MITRKQAHDVACLYRERKKHCIGPVRPEQEIEIPGLWKTSCFTLQHCALLALTRPAIFSECMARIEDSYQDSNKNFLRHVDDVVENPIRLPSISRYWYRRGVTDAVAETMVARRAAKRRIALPRFVPPDADVIKAAKCLARLYEVVRMDAADAVIRAAADEARAAAVEEDRRAKAEAARIDAEHDEMVACGDDVLLAGME